MSVPCSRDPLIHLHDEALPEKKGILGKLKPRKGELRSQREREREYEERINKRREVGAWRENVRRQRCRICIAAGASLPERVRGTR
jgi:hypothetical protein